MLQKVLGALECWNDEKKGRYVQIGASFFRTNFYEPGKGTGRKATPRRYCPAPRRYSRRPFRRCHELNNGSTNLHICTHRPFCFFPCRDNPENEKLARPQPGQAETQKGAYNREKAIRLSNMLFTELTHPVTSGQKAKKPLSATSRQVSIGEFWPVNQ